MKKSSCILLAILIAPSIVLAAIPNSLSGPAFAAVAERERACVKRGKTDDDRYDCVLRAKSERQSLRAEYFKAYPEKAAEMRERRAERREQIRQAREARAAARARYDFAEPQDDL